MSTKNEFKEFLMQKYEHSPTTINNRLSNCANIEKHYGDLDLLYAKDKCAQLLKELEYSTEDMRERRPANHKITINGDIRTGSATLKQALKLYVDFRESNKDETAESYEPQHNKSEEINKITEAIKSVKYIKEAFDVCLFQENLCRELESNMADYNWKTEEPHQSGKHRDRVDIYGVSTDQTKQIVIELDAHRADQVAKKFVSRAALFSDKETLFVSLCYEGTKKMNKNECAKYFDYCGMLTERLSKPGLKFDHFGYFLE